MEKKIIFLELPMDVIEKIDDKNKIGTRSIFIMDLLQKQFQTSMTEMDTSTQLSTHMQAPESKGFKGEINLVDNQGVSLGKFNINTEEGFEKLAKKISQISDDPIVRIKSRRWL